MFWNYDITFCCDKDCPRTDCRRHHSKIPKGIPVSILMESPKKDDKCDLYWKEEQKRG